MFIKLFSKEGELMIKKKIWLTAVIIIVIFFYNNSMSEEDVRMQQIKPFNWTAKWIGPDLKQFYCDNYSDLTFEGCFWIWSNEENPQYGVPREIRYLRARSIMATGSFPRHRPPLNRREDLFLRLHLLPAGSHGHLVDRAPGVRFCQSIIPGTEGVDQCGSWPRYLLGKRRANLGE